MKRLCHTAMLVGAALVGLVACTTYSTAPALTDAEAAVRAAREVGAMEQPDAALHVRYAEEQIDEARQLINDDEFELAGLVLDRATADAELAIALAKSQHARARAASAQERVQELRQEIGG